MVRFGTRSTNPDHTRIKISWIGGSLREGQGLMTFKVQFPLD
jgi:hypothetical protein